MLYHCITIQSWTFISVQNLTRVLRTRQRFLMKFQRKISKIKSYFLDFLISYFGDRFWVGFSLPTETLPAPVNFMNQIRSWTGRSLLLRGDLDGPVEGTRRLGLLPQTVQSPVRALSLVGGRPDQENVGHQFIAWIDYYYHENRIEESHEGDPVRVVLRVENEDYFLCDRKN